MARAIDDYDDIVFVDFEFIAKPGERPDVVCLAWHERSGETHRLWRDELGDIPPYRTDAGVLFVCFVGNAELTCHLALGWPLPVHVLDLNPAFRCMVNGRTVPAGRGLLGALAYFRLPSIGSKHKDAMRDLIMRGWPFTAEEREQILRYCASDVDAMIGLLERMRPSIDLEIAHYHGEFVKVSAIMEHRGVPIDMEIHPRLVGKQSWAHVRDAMVPEIDAAYGVYIRDKAGEWHFSMELFRQYLDREGIIWPVTKTGALSTSRKTFENMAKGHPQLEALRQLRHMRDKMRKIKLAIKNHQLSWWFDGEPLKAVLKDSATFGMGLWDH